MPAMSASVNLTKRVLTPTGLRYCPIVMSANGRVRPDVVELTDVSPIASVRDRIAGFGKAMSAEQLAGILGVSEITVYKHAKAGKIPSFRIGTCVRFCPQTVAQWVVKQ